MAQDPGASVFVLGIGATSVGRCPDKSFADLLRIAYIAALNDAQLEDIDRIQGTWFANSMMDLWGQRGVRGQAALLPLMTERVFPDRQPVINVEAGCAGGSVAFSGAYAAIRQGADLALAIGVEKMNHEERSGHEVLQWMEGLGNAIEPELYWDPYRKLAAELGTRFELSAERSLGMDVYAVLALSHMHQYGTTAEQIALAAAKNHRNAVNNPRAQYHFSLTAKEVLSDRMVVPPLTRAMCAPRGDGAAAVLLCSQRYLDDQPRDVVDRALVVSGHTLAGGRLDAGWESDRAPVRSARDSCRQAGVDPGDLDLVVLHDATSFAEIHLVEDLGLCPRGSGGAYIASGASERDGVTPVNPSGGLVSRGHPIAATGIMMLNELAIQLRGEGGEGQVEGARVGMAENAGGFLGLDVAVCSTTILEGRS